MFGAGCYSRISFELQFNSVKFNITSSVVLLPIGIEVIDWCDRQTCTHI